MNKTIELMKDTCSEDLVFKIEDAYLTSSLRSEAEPYDKRGTISFSFTNESINGLQELAKLIEQTDGAPKL